MAAVIGNSKVDDLEIIGGRIVALQTFMEHKAAVETIEVYTAPVPAKKANAVVSALRDVLPPHTKSGIDLQHLRRLVREELLPKHVLDRIRSTAISNAVTCKVDCEFAIVEVEGDVEQQNQHPKSRTSSSSSNNSTRPVPVLTPRNISEFTNNATMEAIASPETTCEPEKPPQEATPKKKTRRRSSAEKRAAKRERERIALQKLQIANALAEECAVQSPPSTPEASPEVTPIFPVSPTSPTEAVGPSPAEPTGENVPPSTTTKRRRRSSAQRRRSRSGSSSTESSGTSVATRTNSPKAQGTPKKTQKPNMLYLLICPTTAAELSTLYTVLTQFLFPASPEISTIEVPLHASISQEQADEWSTKYWPAIYKRGNPFGPHPPYVEQTINKTLPNVPKWISLAREAAKQVADAGYGIETGAVVVDPSNEEVAAVAGDGRYMTFGGDERAKGCAWGNPLEHAVMRVVGMVAAKRQLRENLEIGVKVDPGEGIKMMKERESTLRHGPVTDIERKHFYTISSKVRPSAAIVNSDNTASTSTPSATEEGSIGDMENNTEKKRRESKETGEYLCHNHIVYLTHEPCVMCSMALIHSRIGMVVIDGKNKAARPGWGGLYVGGSQYHQPSEERKRKQQRLERRARKISGGSSSESETEKNDGGTGYGLFWRKELNWKFLAFEWIEPGQTPGNETKGHEFYV